LVRRTNYKNEKRTKELDKQKKKEAKKERKMNKDKTSPDEIEYGQGIEQVQEHEPGQEENV
jgi:hypothetical protein